MLVARLGLNIMYALQCQLNDCLETGRSSISNSCSHIFVRLIERRGVVGSVAY